MLFYVKNRACLTSRHHGSSHSTRRATTSIGLMNSGWAITRRTMDLARAVYFRREGIDGVVNGSAWLTRLASRITGGTDQYFVDGLVNAIAAFIVRLMSPLFRAAQTGFTQNYALVMVVGLVARWPCFCHRHHQSSKSDICHWNLEMSVVRCQWSVLSWFVRIRVGFVWFRGSSPGYQGNDPRNHTN